MKSFFGFLYLDHIEKFRLHPVRDLVSDFHQNLIRSQVFQRYTEHYVPFYFDNIITDMYILCFLYTLTYSS